MQKPSENSPEPKWIDIEDFEFICFNLAKELMEFNEPIPSYSKANLSLLESSLAAPRNSYELAGSSLAEQSSILFYSLIKNHPFENGNKRIAVATLLVYLYLNEKWIKIKQDLLYQTAVLVAKSKPNQRERVLENMSVIFGEFIIDKKN